MKFFHYLNKWLQQTAKPHEKRYVLIRIGAFFTGSFATTMLLFVVLFVIFMSLIGGGSSSSGGSGGSFNGVYSEELPIFDEIKGTGKFSDEVAQLAVGVGIKYQLLPSVVLSQWAYESAWGESGPARNDNNYFGITWFTGCPFPQGSARGIGGSEGGYYMRFPTTQASFSYYGYMVAVQSNFNACVRNTSPSECLLILGRGGYAAAGITSSSPYFVSCMQIIESNNLTKYDEFAISRWGSESSSGGGSVGKGDLSILESKLGTVLNNGECYGLTAYYVSQLGGPQLMGSGFVNACDIGTDYRWENYGWEVILNPSYSDIQPGDIVNFQAGYGFAVPYGHTGIAISATSSNVTVYDQWAGHGTTKSTYARPVKSIVRKVG